MTSRFITAAAAARASSARRAAAARAHPAARPARRRARRRARRPRTRARRRPTPHRTARWRRPARDRGAPPSRRSSGPSATSGFIGCAPSAALAASPCRSPTSPTRRRACAARRTSPGRASRAAAPRGRGARSAAASSARASAAPPPPPPLACFELPFAFFEGAPSSPSESWSCAWYAGSSSCRYGPSSSADARFGVSGATVAFLRQHTMISTTTSTRMTAASAIASARVATPSSGFLDHKVAADGGAGAQSAMRDSDVSDGRLER